MVIVQHFICWLLFKEYHSLSFFSCSRSNPHSSPGGGSHRHADIGRHFAVHRCWDCRRSDDNSDTPEHRRSRSVQFYLSSVFWQPESSACSDLPGRMSDYQWEPPHRQVFGDWVSPSLCGTGRGCHQQRKLTAISCWQINWMRAHYHRCLGYLVIQLHLN